MTPAAASSPTDTAALWEALATDLRHYLRRRVRDEAVAEDLLQDVFVRVHEHRQELRESDRLVPWVYRIARNAVTDHFRARPTTPLGDHEPGHGSEGTEGVPGADGEDTNPNRVLGAWLRLMIHTLPEPYREALELTELQGLSQKEAAQRLGLSHSGMKSRVQRGRVRLRTLLDRCCEVALDGRGRVIDYRCRNTDPCC